MKSSTLCLILILSTFYHQGLCVYIKENEKLDSAADLVNPQMEKTEILEPVETLARNKRHVGLHICTYCCNCCKNKGCGYCCRT